MASTFSTNLKIELQTTGENSGTWGTITNTNLGTALEQAIVGYGNPSYASDANLTLTYTDTNAAQTARALVLNVTSAVSLTGTRELVVPTIQKQYIVQNNTTGSQSITVKTSGGTGITVPNGRKAHLYVNGTDVIYMDDYVDINGGAIDGTPIGANSASTGAFTTLAASGNVTLSGGTANGVLYLNGSKVATSGSALVFDGTNFGLGVASPANYANYRNLAISGTTGANIDMLSGSTKIGNLFNDATNFYAYNVTAGSLVFGTNNAERARFDSSGNLGIGTASPAQKLHVASAGNNYIVSSNTSGSTSALLLGSESGQNTIYSWTTVAGSTGRPLAFYTGASEAMRLDTSGNLGLGVTPSAWGSIFKAVQVGTGGSIFGRASGNQDVCQVGANVFWDGSNWKYIASLAATRYEQASGTHVWSYAASGTAGNTITFTEAMTLNASGNLGIGTTSPSTKLNVVGTVTVDGVVDVNGGQIDLDTGQPIRWGGAASGIYAGSGTNDMVFTVGSAERFRVNGASGNFGIGTSSPAAKLDVQGSSSDQIRVRTAGTEFYRFGRNSSTGFLDFYGSQTGYQGYTFGGVDGTWMTINSSGNLAVGTTTVDEILRLNGSSNATARIRLQNQGTTLGWFGSYLGITALGNGNDLFVANATNNALIFGTNGTERARITAAGFVGIGTDSPVRKLSVLDGSNTLDYQLQLGNTSTNCYDIGREVSSGLLKFYGNQSGFTGYIFSGVNGERARITSGGDFGIGTASPEAILHVAKSTSGGIGGQLVLDNNASTALNNATEISFLNESGASGSGTRNARIRSIITNAGDAASALQFYTWSGSTDAERARITSGGEFLVGRTSTIGSSYMCVQGGPIGWVGTNSGVDGTYIDWLVCASYAANTSEQHRVRASISGTAGNSGIQFMISDGGGASTQTESFRINRTSCTVVGSLSKGSGSFKIDHPLKPDTHHLVHSFIEGPQADLIYRGKATLVNGRAEVNIDTAAGMTEGTFVALCREVQCFTSNESDWDAVRGSVSGNKLTIECQNQSSSAVISWLVIGERQDKHMYDTDWTDENGKVIVEPKK